MSNHNPQIERPEPGLPPHRAFSDAQYLAAGYTQEVGDVPNGNGQIKTGIPGSQTLAKSKAQEYWESRRAVLIRIKAHPQDRLEIQPASPKSHRKLHQRYRGKSNHQRHPAAH